jgi:hypothetical protein
MILNWFSCDGCAVPLMEITAGRTRQIILTVDCKTYDKLVRCTELTELGSDVGSTNRELFVYGRPNADKLSVVLESHSYEFAFFLYNCSLALRSKIRSASFMPNAFSNTDSVCGIINR